MKCVEIVGGLGNQMFCYAFSRYLRKPCFLCLCEVEKDRSHNGYELGRVFGIEPTRLDSFVQHLYERGKYKKRFFSVISEKVDFEFDSEIGKERCTKIVNYYKGYWQNEAYLKPNERFIRKVFRFDPARYSKKSKELAVNLSGQTNSVSIHIRRGDYYSDSGNCLKHGNICDHSYYDRAIGEIKSRLGNVRFYVFSDEPIWVKENFTLLADATYVDWNSGLDSWQDMALMSCCTHHIIANSSFSWWGAWLATPFEGKVVITPSKWLNNLTATSIVPKNWIKI